MKPGLLAQVEPKGRPPLTSYSHAGFTAVELAVVICFLCFFAAVLVPGFAKAQPKTQGFQCLNNLRQLTVAIAMYAHDHYELLPPNPDDANTVAGHRWCPGLAGLGLSNEYDPDILSDKRYSLLSVYLAGQTGLYHCPADPRSPGRPTGTSRTNSAYASKFLPPARTISMNGAVGTVCLGYKSSSNHSGPPRYPVDGPWLNNTHSHRANQPWRTYGKTSEIVAPTPSRLFVLIDENPLGLNESTFAFGMNYAEWIDFPGIAHEMGCGFGFADGHAEIHKWADPRTRITGFQRVPIPGSPDWLWMSEHTSAKAK